MEPEGATSRLIIEGRSGFLCVFIDVAIKLKVPDRRPVAVRSKSRYASRPARVQRFSFRDPLVKLFVAGFLLIGIIFMGVFAYYYVKYERLVDRRMAAGFFSNAAKIYARPATISPGEKLDASEVAADLRRAGYSEGGDRAHRPLFLHPRRSAHRSRTAVLSWRRFRRGHPLRRRQSRLHRQQRE